MFCFSIIIINWDATHPSCCLIQVLMEEQTNLVTQAIKEEKREQEARLRAESRKILLTIAQEECGKCVEAVVNTECQLIAVQTYKCVSYVLLV